MRLLAFTGILAALGALMATLLFALGWTGMAGVAYLLDAVALTSGLTVASGPVSTMGRQLRALPAAAMGTTGVRQLPGRAAGHRNLSSGQPRVPVPGRVRRRWDGLSGHSPRHRLAHPDGQRAGCARVGRRRHRGRGRDARPADQHAGATGRRAETDWRVPRRDDRDRPGAHRRRAALAHRRGRCVRGVLRTRGGERAAGEPGDAGQHEPGVRLDGLDLPDR